MERALDEFLAWLAANDVDPAYHPVYRRCVEWIVQSAGRTDFDGIDVEEAAARTAADPGAARQVDNIRTAGEAWRRWRAQAAPPPVSAPPEHPERAWIERARVQLAARREVRAAHLILLRTGREARPVLWVELIDGVAAPAQVIGEIAARLPACQIDERLVDVRCAEAGELHELARQVGLAIFERPAGSSGTRTPTIHQQEATQGVLTRRYTLQLSVELDGSIPLDDCLRAVDRRIAAWRGERAARAHGVTLDLVVPRQLHDGLAAGLGRWRRGVESAGLQLQLAVYDEDGAAVTV